MLPDRFKEAQTAVSELCPERFYCPSGTSEATKLCTVGHFCEEGSSSPESCAAGYYQNDTGHGACKTCPAGFVCDGEGTVAPSECPSGYYCPPGTSIATQHPCANGTFNNVTMLTAADECQACLPGMYCDRPGLVTPCLLYTSPSPRDRTRSRMPSSA